MREERGDDGEASVGFTFEMVGFSRTARADSVDVHVGIDWAKDTTTTAIHRCRMIGYMWQVHVQKIGWWGCAMACSMVCPLSKTAVSKSSPYRDIRGV